LLLPFCSLRRVELEKRRCRADQLEWESSWMTVAEQSIKKKRDLRTGTPVWAA
jgi:hypothetical protein